MHQITVVTRLLLCYYLWWRLQIIVIYCLLLKLTGHSLNACVCVHACVGVCIDAFSVGGTVLYLCRVTRLVAGLPGIRCTVTGSGPLSIRRLLIAWTEGQSGWEYDNGFRNLCGRIMKFLTETCIGAGHAVSVYLEFAIRIIHPWLWWLHFFSAWYWSLLPKTDFAESCDFSNPWMFIWAFIAKDDFCLIFLRFCPKIYIHGWFADELSGSVHMLATQIRSSLNSSWEELSLFSQTLRCMSKDRSPVQILHLIFILWIY